MNEGKKRFGNYAAWAPIAILGVVLLAGIIGSIYSIGADEVGVIQRFGRFTRLSGPGLHIKLPFGIERMTPVKVKRIFKEEFGRRTIQPGRKTRYSSRQFFEESLMLTGDLNILDAQWIAQFRVKDPVKLLFRTENPLNNVRDMAEVVMRRLVGDFRVDEVLTTKREEIDSLAQQQMQEILDNYNTGIQVVTVKLLDVNPPDPVKPAFNEVNEAKQEKERVINQAWEAYNKVVPLAKGEAERTIREAEGYDLDKVNRALGEAERFLETWKAYQKAPQITKERLYLDTMKDILPKAKDKYIIDPKQTSILPLLNIGEKGGTAQ